jgi:tRNA1(Val) A37 N6-methylase TrmN6
LRVIPIQNRSDEKFNVIVRKELRFLSKVHWTPVDVIDQCVKWLPGKQSLKVLDIGSGIGKFCILASQISPHCFTGVELREDSHLEAVRLQSLLKLENVNFLNSNVDQIAFEDYDVFYLFNPFYEQIVNHGTVLNHIKFHKENYHKYETYVISQLKKCSTGKLVICFEYDLLSKISGFELIDDAFEGSLQIWRSQTLH